MTEVFELMRQGLPVSDSQLDEAFGGELELFIVDSARLALPPSYKDHGWIKGTCFYTAPLELLNVIASQVPAIARDQLTWLAETSLADSCGDHTATNARKWRP
jgi:hypothetical protein